MVPSPISYNHLSFPLFSNNTSIPVLRTFNLTSSSGPLHILFLFSDSLTPDVSMVWAVSSSECLLRWRLWQPYLEHQVALMAIWFIVYINFKCLPSIKMQAPVNWGLSVWFSVFILLSGRAWCIVVMMYLLNKGMSKSPCLQISEHWFLDLIRSQTQKDLLGTCLIMWELEGKLYRTMKNIIKRLVLL